MEVLRRHRPLAVLAAVVAMEWAVLSAVYFNLSWDERVKFETTPLFGLAVIAGNFVLWGSLMAILFVAVAFRPYLPLVFGMWLVIVGVIGILVPFIPLAGCGCEPGG